MHAELLQSLFPIQLLLKAADRALDWFADVFKKGMMANIPASFTRSIQLAAVVSVLTVVFSVAAALAFRRPFPGSGVVF